MTFPALSVAILPLLVVGLLPARAEDLSFFSFTKGRYFVQTSAVAPAPDSLQPWAVTGLAADHDPADSFIGSARVDAGTNSLVLSFSSLNLDFFGRTPFPSQAAMDAAFPNGNCSFSILTANDGLFGSLLSLNGDTYPNAPYLRNFAAAQEIAPAADFVLQWDAFAGGGTNDLVNVIISDDQEEPFYFETAPPDNPRIYLNGRTTSFLIPAGTLEGSARYHVILQFRKQAAADVGGSHFGVVGYESVTSFDIQTTPLRRSPTDAFPVAVTHRNETTYDLAYGGGTYLAAMVGRQPRIPESDDGEILAVRIGRDGSVSEKINMGRFGYAPAVAFGRNRFLLVWDDKNELSGERIFGQFILPNGALSEMAFPISDDLTGVEDPDVAFDGTNFIVTWTARDGFGESTVPRARLINPDNVFANSPFTIATEADNVSVAAGGGKFLAVAVDSDSGSGVYGQFISASGALAGPVIAIDTSPLRSKDPRQVFFDPVAQRFVVAFGDGSSETAVDLFARTVDLSGNVGPRKTIATGANFQGAPFIASDGHLLLMTWINGIFSPTVTSRAQFFDSNLKPVGAALTTFLQHGDKVPFFAPVQFDGSRFLIVNSAVQLLPEPDGGHDFVNGDTYARFLQPNAPGIHRLPADQNVANGGVATFGVEATGPPPLTYQWQRNGVNLPGQTASTLALAGVTPASAGAFRVVISNSFGVTTSPAAQLSVLQPPGLVTQPQSSLAANFNAPVTFTVVASGSEPLSYQWRLNGINLPGKTGSSLTVQAGIETQGSYSVTVVNPVGATNSAEAALTLQGPSLDFKDTFAQRNVITGGNAFGDLGGGTSTGATKEPGEPNHAGKTGGASVWYGWLAPASGVVTFATTGSGFDTLLAVYTGPSVDQLTPVTFDDDSGGAFASRVTFNVIEGTEYILAVDGLGARTGRIFLAWDLDTLSPSAPVITSSPASRTVPAGSLVSLQVTVQSATPVQYQWFKDNEELTGQTSNTLVIPSFTAADIGSYVGRVMNDSIFPAFSVPAFLELGALPALTTEDKFEDARLDAIELAATTAFRKQAQARAFTAPVAGTIVTHNFGATKQSGEPNHGGVLGGASRWFAVRVATAGSLAVDTFGSDFDTVLAVYTGTSLAALQLLTQDHGSGPEGRSSRVRFEVEADVSYFVAVDGTDGAQGNITLNYLYGVAPQITQAPASQRVIAGNDFTLRIIANASLPTYLWRFNGVPVRGATNAELTIARCQPTDQGAYTVEVANPLGSAVSAVSVSVLSAKTKPTITLTAPVAGGVFIMPTNLFLSAVPLAFDPQKVEFFQNKRKIGESTFPPYQLHWTPPAGGKYALTAKVTDGQKRGAISKGVKIVVLQPIAFVTQPVAPSVLPGGTATFRVSVTGSAPITYQWLFNGAPVAKASKSVLTLRNVQTNVLGNYSVRVTNPAGSVVSSPAALTFNP